MQNNSGLSNVIDAAPVARSYVEKIGNTEWDFKETVLDVQNDVVLWNQNPRLVTQLDPDEYDEDNIADQIRQTNGYDQLKRSIEQIGQTTPIYVWRPNDNTKFLVFEGNTRVTCMRELELKFSGGPKAGTYRRIKVRILPPHFGDIERAILLGRIHVTRSGVRAWGRYEQSRFLYTTVTDLPGKPAVMSVSELAKYLEKTASYVTRLRDAYEFSCKFCNYLESEEDENAKKITADQFSTLEEISKATNIGPRLRDYENKDHDSLRADVFDMVKKEVFKEYRDARFLKEFYETPEIWAALKTGEKHIASKYALEIKLGNSGIKAKISNIGQAVERALQTDDHGLDDDDIDQLQKTLVLVQNSVHPGVDSFNLDFKRVIATLSNATLANVKSLSNDERDEFKQAHEYFTMLVERYGKSA
jgi:hypothetical protein